MKLYMLVLNGLFVVIVAALINLVTNLLGAPITSQPSYPWVIVSLFVVAVPIGIYLNIKIYQQDTDSTNRQRMKESVKNKWNMTETGLTDDQLSSDAKSITLELHIKAVDHSGEFLLQPEEQVPSNKTIVDVYDDANQKLLILGEPGSGKTTLLLKLTEALLNRAEGEHPIPVVFNLSSWSQKPIDVWLVEELNAAYQVPREVGKKWVDIGQILPLLDGLDQVAPAFLAECVVNINKYLYAHRNRPIVICCQTATYLKLKEHPYISTHVFPQPLSLQKIDGYLLNSKVQLKALCEVIHEDRKLRDIASTPLMLFTLAQAYSGKSKAELLEILTDPTFQQEDVFDAYVDKMLSRKDQAELYNTQQARDWLRWLAKKLQQFQRDDFYIERMQPEWLPDDRSRQLYLIAAKLLPRLLIGLAFGMYIAILFFGSVQSFKIGLLGGVIFGLMALVKEVRSVNGNIWSWRNWVSSLVRGLVIGVLLGLINGLVSGLHIGLLVGIMAGLILGPIFRLIRVVETEVKPANRNLWSWATWWRSITRGLIIGFIIYFFFDLLNGLFFGICFGLLSGLIERVETEIKPAEKVNWSWISQCYSLVKGFLQGILFGLASSVIVGLSTIPLVGLGSTHGLFALVFGIFYALHFGLPFGLLLGLVRGLVNGLSSDMLEQKRLTRPNEGIRRSAYNGVIRIGLVNGLFIAIIIWLFLQLIRPETVLSETQVIVYGIAGGLVGWLVTGLFGGGNECIKHAILRLLLRRTGCIPRNYSKFLDNASDRLLMRKIGGGYKFRHPLLGIYFARDDHNHPYNT
jgi:energy-coupling factor transporter ATP-binding protein EcfA2